MRIRASGATEQPLPERDGYPERGLYRVVHGAPSLDRVPPTVRPLIEHCLAKDPRQRPTANGLLAEVGALQPGGTWLPESLTRTFAQGTPSRPEFAWSGRASAL